MVGEKSSPATSAKSAVVNLMGLPASSILALFSSSINLANFSSAVLISLPVLGSISSAYSSDLRIAVIIRSTELSSIRLARIPFEFFELPYHLLTTPTKSGA